VIIKAVVCFSDIALMHVGKHKAALWRDREFNYKAVRVATMFLHCGFTFCGIEKENC